MRTLAATLILLVATSSALACGPAPSREKPWEPDKHAMKGLAPLPTVAATAELRHRPPMVPPGASIGCDQFARFVIRIRLDPSSSFRTSDFGYVFRVRTKNAPSIYALPDYPIQANVVNGIAELDVEVYDVDVGPRPSIDVEVEVRAVDRRLRRGPKSVFRLTAQAIGTSESVLSHQP